MAQSTANLETINTGSMKLESKIGSIPHSDERIYNFLSNFDNFRHLIPADRVQDWQSDESSCSFTINPIGRTGVKIIDKQPFKLIKLTSLEESKFNFIFWVQLKSVSENDTRIKLTLEAELNSMLEMMASKPLQEFLDKLVDQLTRYPY
jgi:carbon monoxide dehydrogenase subunit G